MSQSSALTDGSVALGASASEPRPPADTKERLLDAAEHVFAERGFEGTSMRAVTQAAGAAVSAANYHFGWSQSGCHVWRLWHRHRQRLSLPSLKH